MPSAATETEQIRVIRGVVLDFDGTVTLGDIGDLVCDRFAPPRWREIDERWVRGELSLQQAQEQMWSLCRCEHDEAVAYAQEVGHVRPGLDLLLRAAREAEATVWLASGGFDFYIEPLLGADRLPRFARRFYNTADFVAGTVRVRFPYAGKGLSCARCAVCKGRVCQLMREAVGGEVAFIGDGYSDRCVLDHGRADRLLAVSGAALERLTRERGVPAHSFTDFAEAAALLFPNVADATRER